MSDRPWPPWPSTHVNAGKSVEVMPVADHERALAELAALRDAAQAVLETFDSGRAVQVPDDEPCPELDALRAALAASPASSGPGLLERAARRSRDGAGLASPEGLGISEEERHG